MPQLQNLTSGECWVHVVTLGGSNGPVFYVPAGLSCPVPFGEISETDAYAVELSIAGSGTTNQWDLPFASDRPGEPIAIVETAGGTAELVHWPDTSAVNATYLTVRYQLLAQLMVLGVLLFLAFVAGRKGGR